MDHATHSHTSDHLKAQAKRLRAALLASGTEINHSASLELIAKTHGHRDWNTASAMTPNAPISEAASPPKWHIGARLKGRYLGSPFIGTLVSVARKGNAYFDIAIQFDAPVNVSKSTLFDAPRQRIRATVGKDGRSVGITSDGVPHLVFDFGLDAVRA